MRKLTAMLSALMASALLISAASGEGLGITSQFGFQGWPATPKPVCTTSMGAKPTGTPAVTTLPQPDATQTPTAVTPAPPAATSTPKPTAAATPSTVGDYTTVSAEMQEQKAWNLLNQDRARSGLAPLPLDAELSRLAHRKSQDMKTNHYFAHESPTLGRAKDMLTAAGYPFASVGENIAHHATVEKAQAAFLSSADHRRNMLSSAWTKVGIGIAIDAQGFVYVTQLFVR